MPKFAAMPASVSAARDHVAEAFAAADDETRWAAVLLTSELVSNVLKHTDSEIAVTVEPGPPIRVGVHDGVAATEAFRAAIANPPLADPTATAGRGMGLVHALATSVGLDDDPDGGKVVWFEL